VFVAPPWPNPSAIFLSEAISQMLKLSIVLFFAACSFGCTARGENMKPDEPAPKPEHARLYPITVDGKFGFIDESGNVKFMLPEEVYTIFPFSGGLAVAGKRVPNTNGRWGFIDENGKYVIEANFVMVKSFSEGLAAVVFKESENAYRTVGYIDRSGRIVIPPQFSGEDLSERGFSEGLAAVKVYKDGKTKWGYIDKSGKVVIEPQFPAAGPFSQGRAMVGIAEPSWSIDYKWGFIDTEGRWIAKPQYKSAGEFSEGLAPVLMNDKVGFIDLRGQMAIEPQFDPDGGGGCVAFGRVGASRFSEGLAAVHLESRVWGKEWGFIDQHGNWVIQPAFACAAPFSEGLALIGVREDEGAWRYGYIDKTGAIVIKPQFSQASSFEGKLAAVTLGMTEEQAFVKALESGKPEAEMEKELEKFKQKHAYIDRTGKVVWQTPD
jgi:WG repeat protein